MCTIIFVVLCPVVQQLCMYMCLHIIIYCLEILISLFVGPFFVCLVPTGRSLTAAAVTQREGRTIGSWYHGVKDTGFASWALSHFFLLFWLITADKCLHFLDHF